MTGGERGGAIGGPSCGAGVRAPVARDRSGSFARLVGRAGSGAGDRGSVTAEFAVLLPVVVLVLGVVAALTAGATTQLRCVDAARVAARSASLGDDDAAVAEAARRVAGAGAHVVVSRAEGWVDVTVEAGVGPDLPLVGGLVVRGAATGRAEP